LLEYLNREVLKPMQMDYANDYKFICAGTPPSVKNTYGEHAWKKWEVPHFFWTYKDNPHPLDVALREQFVADDLKEQGLDASSPKARREYGGEWVYDDDLLLYPEVHSYDAHKGAPPQMHIDLVLFGMDYGVSDNDTLVGIAWDSAQRKGFEFFESKFNRLDIRDKTISQLDYLRSEVIAGWREALTFFPSMSLREANKRVLWTADDNDQHITDDFNVNVRHPDDNTLRLQIQNANKAPGIKVMMFDKIRGLFMNASLLVIDGGKLQKECESTVFKRGKNGQVYPEVDTGAYHPDLLPALRYALWDVIGQEDTGRHSSGG
jgi:hypothetical protein